jgi:multicomponent Na+:H+ antiporter subunit C
MTVNLILAQTAMDQFLGLYNYWIVIFLMMTGFYIVIARENLVKTIIGLNIFQTSVFLLYITMGKIHGGTAPILKGSVDAKHGNEEHARLGVQTLDVDTSSSFEPADSSVVSSSSVLDDLLDAVDAEEVNQIATVGFQQEVAGQAVEQSHEIIYSNPLPSVLMLTAIVVGIATTALALALVVRIREEYGTIEENEILELDRNT